MYSYPEQEYINSQTKLKIWCKQCSEFFWQDAEHHVYRKQGCPSCNFYKLTTEEFVTIANRVHGHMYDYSKVVYKGSNTKIEIICPEHGSFWQRPNNHTGQSNGCPDCASLCFVSIKETVWLNTLGIPDDLQHRQTRVGRFKVDGLLDNVVYEFNGTYWHGDPRKYAPDIFNKKQQKTMGELYDRTLRKQAVLEGKGYTVKFVWELDRDAGLLFSEKHPTYA